jgi:hypothetical protein
MGEGASGVVSRSLIGGHPFSSKAVQITKLAQRYARGSTLVFVCFDTLMKQPGPLFLLGPNPYCNQIMPE